MKLGISTLITATCISIPAAARMSTKTRPATDPDDGLPTRVLQDFSSMSMIVDEVVATPPSDFVVDPIVIGLISSLNALGAEIDLSMAAEAIQSYGTHEPQHLPPSVSCGYPPVGLTCQCYCLFDALEATFQFSVPEKRLGLCLPLLIKDPDQESTIILDTLAVLADKDEFFEDIEDNACPESYRRVLSDFNERELFALMEGEELEHHLLKYEEKRDNNTSIGLCHNERSLIHGQVSTHEDCFGQHNQVSYAQQSSVVDDDYMPWAVPSMEASLLAKNPGIWTVENFLSGEETDKLHALVNKYGNDYQLFGPCKHAGRHPSNAHPMEEKVCFKISSENVCEGPYDLSKCSTQTEKEDSEFISSILAKFQELWSTNAKPLEYIKFQMSLGGTPPVDLHEDKEKSISFVLYLNDGGAAMMFPNADITIKPKKGAVHTWLNTYADGTTNRMADHAVQAQPKEAGKRGVMLLSFEVSPDDVLAAAK